jgi:cytochrome c553
MNNRITAIVLLLGIAAAPAWVRAADPASMTFNSVSVTLPGDDRLFPPGPGVETVNDNCLTCHSVDMVLDQPRLPKAVWQSEVQKMITAYKAPVPQDAIPQIVAYLDSIKGTESGEGTPSR